MKWHYSRLDHLPPGAACTFCSRPLRSLKGIVLSDGIQEAYAGPNCAKKHLGAPEERLLDVARLAMLVVSAGDPDEAPTPASASTPAASSSSPNLGNEAQPVLPSTRQPLPPLDSVVQYLRLRYEAMTGFRFQRSALLSEAYEAIQGGGELDDLLRKRVAGTMRSAAEQNTVFCERNIKFCIGLNHWLQEAIHHTAQDRRGFLEAMLSKLHTRWSLTPAQLGGINAWGAALRKTVHDFPHLETTLFEGIVIPDFMQAKREAK